METIARSMIGAAGVAIACSAVATVLRAEEGASGHYAPGAAASFIDALPGRPAWAMANYLMYYEGSAGGSQRIPSGGQVTAGLNSQAWADSVLALRETDVKLLGGSYAFAVVIPVVKVEVEGEVRGPLGNTFRASDRASGIGDITLYPIMIGWAKGDLKYDVRLGVYAPTGDYETGQLANVGKNFWTVEPSAAVSWLSSKIGLEVTAFAGLAFNTRNDATDYNSGDVFHLDVTVAEHLPLGGLGVIGVGASAFYYQQITGDSGSGADVLGDMKGQTVGVGPVVSLITKIGKADLVAELKWLPELEVENRLKGDYGWLKVGVSF